MASPAALTARAGPRRHGLPVLPTTTIGSFPQTPEVRKARADRKAGRITGDAYEDLMRGEIDRVIALQEDIGLNVLVRGEPERNDMVQYFAEQLDGSRSPSRAGSGRMGAGMSGRRSCMGTCAGARG